MPQRFQISGSRAIILIRLMVGIVFLSEGIQKFLYPVELGAGRFVKVGIPSPELMGPFVGVTEIVCGTLILLGLFIRLAAASSRLANESPSRVRPGVKIARSRPSVPIRARAR